VHICSLRLRFSVIFRIWLCVFRKQVKALHSRSEYLESEINRSVSLPCMLWVQSVIVANTFHMLVFL